MKLLQNFLRDEKGQDIVEYSLLMAAMALATGAVVLPMKNEVSNIWTNTRNQLVNAQTVAS